MGRQHPSEQYQLRPYPQNVPHRTVQVQTSVLPVSGLHIIHTRVLYSGMFGQIASIDQTFGIGLRLIFQLVFSSTVVFLPIMVVFRGIRRIDAARLLIT